MFSSPLRIMAFGFGAVGLDGGGEGCVLESLFDGYEYVRVCGLGVCYCAGWV